MKKTVSVAPMMKRTDRHFHYLVRLLSQNTYFYTEMIHANAILKGDKSRLLNFDTSDQRLVVQIGGSVPDQLSEAAKIIEDNGFKEINLNVGCPSKKVKAGNFGVFLMKDINLLEECIITINSKISIPLSIKCRTGVDEYEGEDFLNNFVQRITQLNVNKIIIHARKAISGLDTKRNRSIPPLNYDLVCNIKNNYKNKEIIINGGFDDIKSILNIDSKVDGVMIGRKVYSDPLFLQEIEQKYFFNPAENKLIEVMTKFMEYILQLPSNKDANRAINHLMAFLKCIPFQKSHREALMTSLRDKKIDSSEVFRNLENIPALHQ